MVSEYLSGLLCLKSILHVYYGRKMHASVFFFNGCYNASAPNMLATSSYVWRAWVAICFGMPKSCPHHLDSVRDRASDDNHARGPMSAPISISVPASHQSLYPMSRMANGFPWPRSEYEASTHKRNVFLSRKHGLCHLQLLARLKASCQGLFQHPQSLSFGLETGLPSSLHHFCCTVVSNCVASR